LMLILIRLFQNQNINNMILVLLQKIAVLQ
jgi:hypothetical protein